MTFYAQGFPSTIDPQLSTKLSVPSYAIITPARNEGQYLQKTIDCVSGQTLRPLAWVIVNDGSTDNTREIIDSAAKQYPWIKGVHRPDRGFRQNGGGVIEAFYEGYSLVTEEKWDYLVKLDADLTFGPDYFASSFDRFIQDPKLGIGGGVICDEIDGILVEESAGDPPFHVRGATKIYRQACWEALGGLIKAPGWDTLDEIKANMLGWKTGTFRDLKLHQHRKTGGADGCWKNWVKNGLANYITGYHPVFMLAKCVRRGIHTGSVAIAAGLGWGFLSGYLKRLPKAEPKLVRYVRQEQVKRLLLRRSLWT